MKILAVITISLFSIFALATQIDLKVMAMKHPVGKWENKTKVLDEGSKERVITDSKCIGPDDVKNFYTLLLNQEHEMCSVDISQDKEQTAKVDLTCPKGAFTFTTNLQFKKTGDDSFETAVDTGSSQTRSKLLVQSRRVGDCMVDKPFNPLACPSCQSDLKAMKDRCAKFKGDDKIKCNQTIIKQEAVCKTLCTKV